MRNLEVLIEQEVTEFRGTGIRTQNLALIWR